MYEKSTRDKGKIKININEVKEKKKAELGRIKRASIWFNGLSNSRKILISVVVFALILGVLLGYNYRSRIRRALFPVTIEIEADYQLLTSNFSQIQGGIVPTPLPVRDKENPINGTLITTKQYNALKNRTPVAITINNAKAARQQHGLSKADIVLEVLTEGGITRYMPIYYGNYDVSKIGPVRSLRYYMIMFASGFDNPVILHEGQAGYDNAPWETYREEADARGAIYKFGIKSMQTAGSRYRDLEKAAVSGYVHSLYTDFDKIKSEISRLGWNSGSKNLETLTFKYDNTLEERGDFKSVTTQFLSLSTSEYSSKFEYDKTSNTYKRFIGGEKDIDLITNQQIAPKNVIFEWHDYSDAFDGHNRIIIDMIGEDNAVILRDGKKIDGMWKKDCRTCRTTYIDKKGEPVPLNRGQIWVVNVVKVGDRLVSNVDFN